MSLRDCTLMAQAYYKSGLTFAAAVWKAIHAFELNGLSFTFRQVCRDWAALRKEKSPQLTLDLDPAPVAEITLGFLDDGRVIVRQGTLSVVLFLEEAKEQYPFLFEED